MTARSARWRAVVGAVTALAMTSTALAQTGQAIGVASAVVKDVKYSNAQVPQPRPVTVRQRVQLADLIQTGKASQMQILLLDRSTFSIGANARLRIDRFVYDPARGRNVGGTVLRGAFRFMSGQPNRQTGSTIATPVATIGIRGTIIEGVVGEGAIDIAKREGQIPKGIKADKNTASLIVLRGPGAGKQGGDDVGAASVTSGGATVELTAPTQTAFVPFAGAAPIVFNLSPAGHLRLRDQVFPSLAKAGLNPLLGGLLLAIPVAAGIAAGGKGKGRNPETPPPDPTGRPPGQ
ncbi:MAG: FecR family protein [Novosphingobium sp.]